jgi:trehalose-phosphatase
MSQNPDARSTEVVRTLAEAPALFCFLDYDGTLAPIAPTPAQAAPLPGTAELLTLLARKRSTRVAIVTGRTVADVRSFIDLPQLYYVGIHGLEIRRPGEAVRMAPSATAVQAAMPAIRAEVDGAVRNLRGVFLEEKGAAIACHYRLASRVDAQAARTAVVAIAERYAERGVPVKHLDGHEVTEIRPADVDKGAAVATLLAEVHPTPLALYIGDDRTDEDAFAKLPLDAITIRVGSPEHESYARFRLPDPAAVRRFLDAVAARRSEE